MRSHQQYQARVSSCWRAHGTFRASEPSRGSLGHGHLVWFFFSWQCTKAVWMIIFALGNFMWTLASRTSAAPAEFGSPILAEAWQAAPACALASLSFTYAAMTNATGWSGLGAWEPHFCMVATVCTAAALQKPAARRARNPWQQNKTKDS